MAAYTKSMQVLIEEFSKMPGVGHKSAERMAFYVLKLSPAEAANFASAITKMKETTGFCGICNNLTEGSVCQICDDSGRNKAIVCVVEGPNDVIAVEKAGGYNGVYHVLMGALSPLEGIGPRDIRVKELLDRASTGKVEEVIIATDSDMDGEATALYITKRIRELKVTTKSGSIKITRLAHGVPVGSNIEYADHATLAKAMEGRRAV